MRAVGEARGKASRQEVALHGTQERTVAPGGAKTPQVERLPRAIRERDLAGFPVDVPDEETGFLDFDLPPEASDLDDILAIFRKEANTPIEGGAQSSVRNGMALMRPASVVVEAQTKRAQGRGLNAHRFGRVSGSVLPSGFTRKTPRKS